MGKLIRCITSDGFVMATAVDTTDIVENAKNKHIWGREHFFIQDVR